MRKKPINTQNDQRKQWRQTVYHRGTRDGSPNYVLLYSDGEISGDEEAIPLSSKSIKKSTPRKIEVIEVKLKSEDTLQALALRYGCKISELKRINKIHKENEIHARRVLQIPVPPFSVLTETVDSPEENVENVASKGELSHEEKIMNLITNPLPEAEINNIIWNSKNIQERVDLDQSAEHDLLLSSAESGHVQEIDHFRCSGADWGITWTQLLLFFLLVCFGAPLIYIVYFESHSDHHPTNVTTPKTSDLKI